MLCAFLTLALTITVLVGLTVLAGRRLAAHVRRHPEALAAIAQHVVLPLFEKLADDKNPPVEVEAIDAAIPATPRAGDTNGTNAGGA
jgi:hypothetical protein